MNEIPDPVLRYLATQDSLIRARIASEHPDLQQMMSDPRTRLAILTWLRSDAARQSPAHDLLINCLQAIHGGSLEEAQIVKPFVSHADPFVRMAAFEFLIGLYYRGGNSDDLISTLRSMLSDESDQVRSLAAHYIENTNVASAMKESLQGWLETAKSVGWERSESFERIVRILKK